MRTKTAGPVRVEDMELLGQNIVVRVDEETRKTKGGLWIPAPSAERPTKGTVLAVGPGKKMDDGTRRQMDTKPGDRILFTKYHGHAIDVEDEDFGSHIMMWDSDVVAILDGDGAIGVTESIGYSP